LAKHHQQRVGAAGAAHDMLGAAEGGKLRLELRHFRAVDELAVREHAGNRFIDCLAEPLALRADIDEGNRLCTQMLVHGALQ
jgi:hypothetical protein